MYRFVRTGIVFIAQISYLTNKIYITAIIAVEGTITTNTYCISTAFACVMVINDVTILSMVLIAEIIFIMAISYIAANMPARLSLKK